MDVMISKFSINCVSIADKESSKIMLFKLLFFTVVNCSEPLVEGHIEA